MASESIARFSQRVAGHERIGLDTSIWIYHLEANPRYLSLTTHLLSGIESGQRSAVMSVVGLMELTVRSFQVGRSEVAQQYEALLVHFPNLSIRDIDRDIARRAAQLRGEFGVGALDALHVATAVAEGATALVTNDLGLMRLAHIVEIIALDEFLIPSTS